MKNEERRLIFGKGLTRLHRIILYTYLSRGLIQLGDELCKLWKIVIIIFGISIITVLQNFLSLVYALIILFFLITGGLIVVRMRKLTGNYLIIPLQFLNIQIG